MFSLIVRFFVRQNFFIFNTKSTIAMWVDPNNFIVFVGKCPPIAMAMEKDHFVIDPIGIKWMSREVVCARWRGSITLFPLPTEELRESWARILYPSMTFFFRVFLHECYLRRQTLKMPNSYLKQYMFLVNLHWVFFSIALIKGHLELILIITIIALILLQTVKLILLLKFVFCSYFEVSSQFA